MGSRARALSKQGVTTATTAQLHACKLDARHSGGASGLTGASVDPDTIQSGTPPVTYGPARFDRVAHLAKVLPPKPGART
jgi:hypothetical protein